MNAFEVSKRSLDTDNALYGRRLVHEIRKNSHKGVYFHTIGRYRVYYAEFTGHSIQIWTMCKRTFQCHKWKSDGCHPFPEEGAKRKPIT